MEENEWNYEWDDWKEKYIPLSEEEKEYLLSKEHITKMLEDGEITVEELIDGFIEILEDAKIERNRMRLCSFLNHSVFDDKDDTFLISLNSELYIIYALTHQHNNVILLVFAPYLDNGVIIPKFGYQTAGALKDVLIPLVEKDGDKPVVFYDASTFSSYEFDYIETKDYGVHLLHVK